MTGLKPIALRVKVHPQAPALRERAIERENEQRAELEKELKIQYPGQMDFGPKMLSGSQKKTCHALRENAEKMIREAGVECCGFCTLTVGDVVPCHRAGCMGCLKGKKNGGHFVQVKDSSEASRRINNLNRRLLGQVFEKAIIVTERHKSGAIHFHVLGIIRGRPNIRAGVDFEAIAGRDYRTASAELRGLWKLMREEFTSQGFGRCELLPIKKTGEIVAKYVAKYIEKNVYNRTPDDKGKKLVRYFGWAGNYTKPNGFGFATPGAIAWRHKTRQAACLVNVMSPEKAAEVFGPRWAYSITKIWEPLAGAKKSKNLVMTWGEREIVRAELVKMAENWAKKADAKECEYTGDLSMGKIVWSHQWEKNNPFN